MVTGAVATWVAGWWPGALGKSADAARGSEEQCWCEEPSSNVAASGTTGSQSSATTRVPGASKRGVARLVRGVVSVDVAKMWSHVGGALSSSGFGTRLTARGVCVAGVEVGPRGTCAIGVFGSIPGRKAIEAC